MTRRKTSRRRPTRMNKVITVAVAVVVLVLMAVTCPKKQQHEDAVKEKLSHVMKQTVDESLGDNVVANLIGGILSNTLIDNGIDYALNHNFCVKDYFLFSVGHFHGTDDKESTISFGIFSHVFTPSEARMREVVEQQREQLLDNIVGN